MKVPPQEGQVTFLPAHSSFTRSALPHPQVTEIGMPHPFVWEMKPPKLSEAPRGRQ